MHKNLAAKHLYNIRLRVVEYAQILPHLTHLSTLPVSPRLPLCNSFSSSCNLSRLGEYQIQPTIDWIRWKFCQEVMSMLCQDSRCFNVLSHCVLLDVCTSIKPNRHRSISSYMPFMGRGNVCPRPWLATVVIPLCPQFFNFLQTKKRHTSERIRYQNSCKTLSWCTAVS